MASAGATYMSKKFDARFQSVYENRFENLEDGVNLRGGSHGGTRG